MSECMYCGKEIKFIRRKGKKSLQVEKKPIYFVPDDNGDELFVKNGQVRRGTKASDGIPGHRLHICEEEM